MRRRETTPPVRSVLAWLERTGTRRVREGMARYAVRTDRAFGVAIGALRDEGKRLGRNHDLAAALWDSGWYEARMLAAFIDDPALVTSAQMERWCSQFDNWAVCDAICFHLFDRTPYAFAKVTRWAGRKGEFQRRAAFALLWALTVHDRTSPDEPFERGLVLVERAAADPRHFVWKAVNMALRATGKRNRALHASSVEVARRLAGSEDAVARRVGKGALRELTSPGVLRRVAAKAQPRTR